MVCSRCGQEGHTRRSTNCPGLVTPPAEAPPQVQQQQQQQPHPQAIQYLGTISSFVFCSDTFVEINADLYDRMLIGKQHFVREFVNRMDDHENNDDKRVFLITITSADSGKSITVNVAGPHREYDNDAIYAPNWVLEALDIHDTGNIFWERVPEPPPRATKISLKLIDDLWNEIDGRAEIEEHLKNFNVLQQGTTIQIPLRPFDNFLATVYVEKTEPASVVLLRDEVELDLIVEQQPSLPPPQPMQRPPTPIPKEPELLFSNSMQTGTNYKSAILTNTVVTAEPQQLPDPQTRRRLQAEAAERRRLASLDQTNTANAASDQK